MILWLQITSGRGPEECCWVVAKLSEHITHEAVSKGIKILPLEVIQGDKPKTFKSVLFALEGENAPLFVKQFEGTVQWVGKSMFRPHHKRKNWFVGVNILSPPVFTHWSENDFRIEAMRSSGPGGQHINKTETAIRIIHVPTGLSATAQEERSQYLNKKLALSRLSELLNQKEKSEKMKAETDRWTHHNSLERGNPKLVYEGNDFRLKNINN
ncbi:MAG: peptide chain release factor H [Desulfobacterales bacterium]|nr:peptide chain release factor H [Desulfobacterales bacterium]